MRNFGGQRQKLFWEKYLKSFSLIIEDVLKRGNPKQEEMNHWLRGWKSLHVDSPNKCRA